MRRRTIEVLALALLLLLAALLTLVLRRQLAADDEANSSPPVQAIEKAPPVVPPRPEPVDLGATLGLDSLADCSRSPALASMLEQMVRFDPETFESRRGGPIRVPGLAQPVTPTFERTREIDGNADIRAVVADLDFPGRWHGLAVSGLRRSFYEESDVGAFQLRFADTPELVREVLARHGFRLPPVGEVREIDEDGMTTSLGIERTEGGAALTCTTG